MVVNALTKYYENCMEVGQTVVLKDLEQLHDSLYDTGSDPVITIIIEFENNHFGNLKTRGNI